MNVLFGQAATVDDVARMIDQSKKLGRRGFGLQDTAVITPQGKAADINFKQESTLDPSITFPPPKKELHEVATLEYHHIFLTGCTGE